MNTRRTSHSKPVIPRLTLALPLLALLACGTSSTSTETSPSPINGGTENWQLVWSDEFDGNAIDTRKWSLEINCWGGGNNEQQCYTDRVSNAFLQDGLLHIVARKESYTGPSENEDSPDYLSSPLRTLPYTSARLRTKHKGDWKFGRFEIRAKLPFGQGTWPAIWMLPTDNIYGNWAASGEIDIVEAVNLKTQTDAAGTPTGKREARVHGTLHYGKAWPGNVYKGFPYELPNGQNPADDFHVYALEWHDGVMHWYVDGIKFATQTQDTWYSQYPDQNGTLITGTGSAPFDQRFHLLLNLAVGGNWAGSVNQGGVDDTVFPQSFLIDYVRVYQKPPPS